MSTAAVTPFEFFTVSHLIRIGNISAVNLNELQTGLKECSDESIFHHTFQTLSSHHYLTEGFSNDFAQWVLADTNRNDLAEQLAASSSDIRNLIIAAPQAATQIAGLLTDNNPGLAVMLFAASPAVRTAKVSASGRRRIARGSGYFCPRPNRTRRRSVCRRSTPRGNDA